MQKLKKVFSPGNDKDDETMYGSPASRKAQAESGSVDPATISSTTAPTLTGKEHGGISQQILNPGGNKYDEQRFGTATDSSRLPEDRDASLTAGMGDPIEDRSVKRQVIDPSSATKDESGYGTTEFAGTSHPIGTSGASSVRPDHTKAASTLSMKSGVLGSPDQRSEERALRSDGIAGGQHGDTSNFSQNAALAGAGTAAGAGTYAATRPNDNIDDSTHTDRSFPLSGGAVASHDNHRRTSSTYSGDAPAPLTSKISDNMSGTNTGTAGGVGAASGAAALANLGLERHSAIDHSGHSHEFNGDPCEVEPAEKTLPFIPGPHATVAANMLDPHVPGEFPREDGLDPHSGHNTAGLSAPTDAPSGHHLGRDAALVGVAGTAGLGAHEALKDHSTLVVQPSSSTSTGSGVSYPAPLGSHEALADRTLPPQQPAYEPEPEPSSNDRHTAEPSTGSDGKVIEPRTGLPMDVGKHGYVTGGTDGNQAITSHYVDPPAGSDSSHARQEPLEKNKEHHYGRDAALVGGAGAAGYGAHEYMKDRNTTDPSSVGSDGRVTEPRTGLPMNVGKYGYVTGGTDGNQAIASHYAHPPVGSDPIHAQQRQDALGQNKEHHHGRDAALVGGAGAAGAAGYSALHNDGGDTGPASKTIGPHKSNIANIVDPRVRPEPEKMKDHSTAGPFQSDSLNRIDPKVQSDPSKADVKAHGYGTGVAPQPLQQHPVDQEKDHHYGRDAAVVGGTGAAAYGATQAYDKHEQEKLAKEQEKLAKEHDKQAQHEVKERAKEQEKQAKHDAKEADKQAKHEAHEAEKARKKEEEKHANELEKQQEKRLKEQEKAEKEHQKELEKLQREKEKEDEKLAAARHEEAEAKHNKHNKLHKEAPEEREEKGGIMHRIFHHKHYEREGAEGSREGGSFEEGRSSGLTGDESFERRGASSTTATRQTVAGESALGKSSFEQPGLGGEGDGMMKEPTTGLPMNVGKYGVGSGGTDGNEAIAGHYAK